MRERLFSLLSLVSWVSYFGHVLLVGFSSSVSCTLVLSFRLPSLPPRGKLSSRLLPFFPLGFGGVRGFDVPFQEALLVYQNASVFG